MTCGLCHEQLVHSGLSAKIEHVHKDCTGHVVERMRWLLDEAYANSRPIDAHIRESLDGALELLEQLHGGPIR